MGLDMYAFKTTEEIPDVDFETAKDSTESLHYWRKHPNLHGWMEMLYRRKGGKKDDFNCAQVQLDEVDLAELELTIRLGQLPHTEGFFFGQSDGSEVEDDLEFVRKAKEALKSGYKVYYDSWW